MPRRLWPVPPLLVCLLAASPPASAAEFTPSDVKAMAQAMAAPWPKVQRGGGSYPDFSDPHARPPDTRYGDAFMGYAQVLLGLKTHDRAAIDSGLRGVSYSVKHWGAVRKHITQSVFENWAVPATYNLARRKLKHDPIFKKERKRWEAFLRVSRAERSGITFRYGNHWLVDAHGVLETQGTGLTSSRSDSVVGGHRSADRAGVLSLVNSRVPALARPGHSPFLLSDPPDNPLAYEGLSVAMYAHLIRLLGHDASGTARNALRRATDALWYDTAPDGDSAYFGRSQEMIWGPAGAAYAGLVAANLSGTSSQAAARYRALADRSFARLRAAYPITKRGGVYVPGLARSVVGTMPWLDGYAGAPSMDGIALLFVELSLGEMRAHAKQTRIAADRNMARAIGSSSGRIAMARRGHVWFAVRLQPTSSRLHLGDLRYDSGISIVKRQLGDGTWADVVPVRPTTPVGRLDSAGPVVLSGDSVAGVPIGDSVRTSTTKGLSIRGAIRSSSGASLAPLRSRYVATSCGVEVLFAAYPGNSYEYSAFFAGNRRPKRHGGKLTGSGQTVTASPSPDSTVLQKGYGSSVDPHLVRARMRFRVSKTRTVHVTMC